MSLRGRISVLTAVLVAATLLAAAPADAKGTDPRTRRREVRAKRAAVAARINALRASDREVERALDALEANVRRQASDVIAARRAAAVSGQRLAAAQAAERASTAKLDRLQASMRRVALRAYVRGPDAGMSAVFDVDTLAESARRQALFELAAGQQREVADQLRAVKEDVALQRVAAEGARQRAGVQKERVERRLSDLKQATAAKLRVANQVENRIDAALAEAQSLAGLDAGLSAELARRQNGIVRRLQTGPATKGPVRDLGRVSVTSVNGITVSVQIASQLAALLNAANAAGIQLGGGGYRDSAQQVALRRAHCGSGSYAIYSAPASRCRPPTARPGASQHERGLAVDFTHGGRVIRSRSSPAFQWLRANAGRFGFRNLPSEPWHWSPSGR